MQQLNEKWIKASILGTIWAASEIVLGSFLHNLRIPFSGNILTAIGLVILISASYKWREKGIFWRAGVICALLKTMSPSAVILGPFISILSEAFLLEFATRMFGRTFAGFILGSILAMSWNLFHKIVKMVIFYGSNIIEVYTNLMQYVEEQIGFQFNAVWTPLFFLLVIQILFGTLAALTGIRTGLEAEKNKIAYQFSDKEVDFRLSIESGTFTHSIVWMTANVILMIGALIAASRINFGIWVVLIGVIVVIWSVRYQRALRQLVRPKIWIFFVLTTMITALVFTRLHSDTKSLTEAIIIGVEMNLRAILLIMGFSVLGTELYNPKIRNWFAGSYFNQVPVALQLSLESLPSMIAHTPELKTIIKNPTLFVYQIMAFADFRLKELNMRKKQRGKIYIVTGDIGAGKTSCLKKTITGLKQNNISVSGIICERVLAGNDTAGYNLADISSGTRWPFLSKTGNKAQAKVGSYFIDDASFKTGEKLFRKCTTDVIVFDEIGKLELRGDGWAKSLKYILSTNYNCLILTLRKEIINELINEFQLQTAVVYDIQEMECDDIALKIQELITAEND
ncbi:nucleoside-triphosphatase [uncultured Draconibacterium sp.]|uniref:nucleoside-triphosphatase n=1 Tax=uncultured Draconibacterium sp. TaxID=1573823 RepID=UPI0032176E24